MKGKSCVILNCNRKAVSKCSSCGIPVCESHLRKVDQLILCTGCFEYVKKLKSRRTAFDIFQRQ